MNDNTTYRVLNLDDILPNRFQPRISFKKESLDELAESISKFGVIEPIVVRPVGNKYEIIAGERRYKASKLASKTTIPSIIVNLTDKDSEELALLENIQRQELNPIEEAVSYKRILNTGNISREELSKKIGKPQSVILNKTRLLNLADEVQKALVNNMISEGHAKALLNLNDLDDQVEMLHRITNERLTVKKTNKEIQNMLDSEETESLFEERGKNMDIDKIMQEAKDINTNAAPTEQAPNLMEAPSTPQPTTQAVNEPPLANPEPTKFVNAQAMENTSAQTVEQPAQAPIDTPTFDNMFKGPLQQPESTVTETPAQVNQPVAPGNEMPQNNISNEVTNALNNAAEQTVVPSPGEIPVVPEPMEQATTPIEIPQSANEQTAPLSQVQEQVDIPQTPIVTTPEPEAISEAQANIPDTDIVNDSASSFPQPPSMSGEIPESPNTINEPVAPQAPLNNAPLENQPIENNVPDNNLLNETAQVISEVTSTPENNTQINQVPNFARIVEQLRKCADDIEKLGTFVNLEEVDLGNQYKVIFTIDK